MTAKSITNVNQRTDAALGDNVPIGSAHRRILVTTEPVQFRGFEITIATDSFHPLPYRATIRRLGRGQHEPGNVMDATKSGALARAKAWVGDILAEGALQPIEPSCDL